MAVCIRLARWGTKKKPYYRVVAADSRRPRNGKCLEIVGTFDPRKPTVAEQCTWKAERLQYWLSQGAVPSETVSHLLPKAVANSN